MSLLNVQRSSTQRAEQTSPDSVRNNVNDVLTRGSHGPVFQQNRPVCYAVGLYEADPLIRDICHTDRVSSARALRTIDTIIRGGPLMSSPTRVVRRSARPETQ